ncbi:MAG: cytochrome c family protein, partial [Alphaproteobacteria bacterium]|nr:cytochrome c family protein [Alphaproteobacteria bacterium]
MDSFEVNKILGAVLGTCLVLLTLNITANALFSVHAPAKPGYAIAVPEQAPAGGPAAPAVAEEPIAVRLAKADLGRGEASFKKCAACHTLDKGGRNLVGPNLWGVVGRDKGAVAGVNYSAAMKAKGGKWTFEELDAYLKNPRGMVPGTNMSFAGIPRDSERGDLLAFLNSKSDSPQPLPKAAAATPAAPAARQAEAPPAAAAPAPAAPPA